MNYMNYLLILTIIFNSIYLISSQSVCNSGEFYNNNTRSCALCSSKIPGCLLCDQTSGECLVCSGLYLSWANPGSTVSGCSCPAKQLLTYNPQTQAYVCANSTVGNSYYNETQISAMKGQLTAQNLQILEAAILGVNNANSNITLDQLTKILTAVQNGVSYVVIQNNTVLNYLARVLTAFVYVPYSNGNIINSVSQIVTSLYNANQSNYITVNYCMEIFGLIFDKLSGGTYSKLPTQIFAAIQSNFNTLIVKFINIKYTDLGPQQQILTNHYTNIWIASMWLDLTTQFYVDSDLNLDYTLTISSANLSGLTGNQAYLTQIVLEKTPIAIYTANSQKFTLLSGVQNIQFFQLQNNVLVNVNSQFLSNPLAIIMGYPMSTNNIPYFVSWDANFQIWQENFACQYQNLHAFCKPNLQLLATSYSFSISEQFKYSTTCKAGEYQSNATACNLCNTKTPNCLSCNQQSGTCEICKGLLLPFQDAYGNITCDCPSGKQLIFNLTAGEFQCSYQQLANQLYTTYLPTIQQYNSTLIQSQLLVLYSLALAINGDDSLPKFQVLINILQNGMNTIINTNDPNLFNQYVKVLLALAYNPSTSYTIISNVGLIVNQIRIANVLPLDAIFYFMEIYGLFDEKLASSSFQWDTATATQKSNFIQIIQTYLDNMKKVLTMQLTTSTTGIIRSFHFTNYYMAIYLVNVTQKFGSGLYLNQYAIELTPEVLSKLPTNTSIYSIHILQEKNPFSKLSTSNASLFTYIQDISFYYGDTMRLGNSYLSNLTQQYAQMLFPYSVIQTYKMLLAGWNTRGNTWSIAGYCSQTATVNFFNALNTIFLKNVASCYPTSLASTNIYAVAKNSTGTSIQSNLNRQTFLKHEILIG